MDGPGPSFRGRNLHAPGTIGAHFGVVRMVEQTILVRARYRARLNTRVTLVMGTIGGHNLYLPRPVCLHFGVIRVRERTSLDCVRAVAYLVTAKYGRQNMAHEV